MALYRRVFSVLLVLTLVCISAAQGLAEYDKNNPQNLSVEHLFAQSVLLVDEDSGEVLFSRNSRVRMYPASTTKIMTLMLALESDIPLDSRVTIPAQAADVPEGSSVIPVKPGDVMTFSDLLYGFMLSSGNDGANAIAVLVDGSIKAFVAHMNVRAAELGCDGTHFVNAHGYHDSEHYTTARDLATMAREAMRNETFRKIVAAPRWTMSIQRNGSTVETEIVSRNSLLQSGEKYYYPDCTGIKTGHHSKAGWCFVGSAEREGMRLICVVLNCEQEMSKWYDAARLFEYGFTRYTRVTASRLLERVVEQRCARVEIDKSDPSDIRGGSLELNLTMEEGGDAALPVVADSETALDAATERLADGIHIEWDRPLVAPIDEGDALGTITCEVNGIPVKARLTASRSVARKPEATEAPTPVATAPVSDDKETVKAPPHSGKASGTVGAGIAIALVILLILAIIALALRLRQARLRRERRRRRKRSGGAPRRRSNGTRREPSACAGSPGRRSALGVRR